VLKRNTVVRDNVIPGLLAFHVTISLRVNLTERLSDNGTNKLIKEENLEH